MIDLDNFEYQEVKHHLCSNGYPFVPVILAKPPHLEQVYREMSDWTANRDWQDPVYEGAKGNRRLVHWLCW